MHWRYVAAAGFAAAWYGFYLALVVVQTRMFAEVNSKLPFEQRIGIVGPSSDRSRIIRLHRQYYPDSRLVRRFYTYWWGNVLSGTAALACVIHFK